jgi:hypothetical protein
LIYCKKRTLQKKLLHLHKGHAASVKDKSQKQAIHQIEIDEWNHRKEVLSIMHDFDIPVSKYYEFRFHFVGKIISFSCYIIGWFMPFYFAGRLESGNVCVYFRMKQFFNSLSMHQYDQILYEMGMKEKDHEVYFPDKIKQISCCLFLKSFFHGVATIVLTIDLDKKYPVENSDHYCKNKMHYEH